MFFALVAGSLVTVFLTFLPISKNQYWLVRAWDFPRAQFLILNFTFLVLFSIFFPRQDYIIFPIVALVISLLLDIYRIFPYTIIFPKQLLDSEAGKSTRSLKILSSNVLVENQDYNKGLDLFKEEDPDILLLMETNSNWKQACSIIAPNYPYKIEQAQENGYGMLMYSKYELLEPEIDFLTDSMVPSFFTHIVFEGKQIQVVALHPRPPGLIKDSSEQRDRELGIAAEHIKNSKFEYKLIVGDFNDVAWSHSTRDFLRDSVLKDPRKGRGFFSTFPANRSLVFLRYPLDHVFLTSNFRIKKLKRLRSINSDHFPISIEMTLGED